LQAAGQDATGEISRMVDNDTLEFVIGRTNWPNALSEDISRIVAVARENGNIDMIQQSILEGILIDITNAQGGMERIKNTPLPMGFRFLPDLFTRLFCLILPVAVVESLGLFTPVGSTIIGMIFLAALKIGDDLTDPFANGVHDVPLSAMCGTIEIDLKEMIDRPAPPPVQPDHGVLW
jgi:putative membrane protein